MGTLWSVLMGITLLTALAIVGLILMQQGKGADLGAAMGGGASGSVFGSSGSGNFLSRATAVLAAVFFAVTLALTYLGQSKNRVVQAEVAAQQQSDEAANVSVLERLQASSSATGAGETEKAAGTADGGTDTAVEQATGDAEKKGTEAGADGDSATAAPTEAVSEDEGTGADTGTEAGNAAGEQSQSGASDGDSTASSDRYTLEDGILRVYFAPGKFAVSRNELPEDFVRKAGFEQAVKDGKKLFISGYVDSTGNAEQNRRLAADRAKAVRDLLLAAGIAQDTVELQKPDAIEQGKGAAARRVEVRIR